MTSIFPLLACAVLLSGQQLLASHAIYKTVGTVVTIGNQGVVKSVGKGYWVLDPDTGRLTAIGSFTVNGTKFVTVVETQNYRMEKVYGKGGAGYTVLAKAESPGTQFAGVLLESVYARGLDSSVIIDYSRGPQWLPRTFKSVSRGINRIEQTGAIVAAESSGTGTLDVVASRASNVSETFEAVVARLKSFFTSRGYTEYTPPAAIP